MILSFNAYEVETLYLCMSNVQDIASRQGSSPEHLQHLDDICAILNEALTEDGYWDVDGEEEAA